MADGNPPINLLQHMVAFRNIAVHDYQSLALPIVESVITQHLDEFLQFSSAVLLQPHSL